MADYKDLEQTLLGSKYCWDKQTQKLIEEEFYGLDDQMGFLDHVQALVTEAEKKAFLAGFFAGANEVCSEDQTVDTTVNQITAERRYLQWR